MGQRIRVWMVVIVLAVVCGGAISAVWYYRYRHGADAISLAHHLPPGEATLLVVDFATLRLLGVLSALDSPEVSQEPDYREFVSETGFDYLRDLDLALVSFHQKSTYLLARGRFRWDALERYARKTGGRCHNTFCEAPGSSPERKISFFPLRNDVLAMAVSSDPSAAHDLRPRRKEPLPVGGPQQPVWVSLPASALQHSEAWHPALQLLAKVVENCEGVTASVGVAGLRAQGEMVVRCRSAEQATRVLSDLEALRLLLRGLIARMPGTAEQKQVPEWLASGQFSRQNQTVRGIWPLEQALLGALLGGARTSTQPDAP